jgi:hypothetical protein
MPPSNIGERPSTAIAWKPRGLPRASAPASSRCRRRRPSFQVRLVASRGDDDRPRGHRGPLARRLHDHRVAAAVRQPQLHDRAVVAHLDAEATRRLVLDVHQRLAAAQEEAVGARQLQRAPQRRLPAHALPGQPVGHLARALDREPGKLQVQLAAGDRHQVGQELVLGVVVAGAADVAGVLAVATPPLARRALQQEHRGAAPPRLDGGAEGGVAPARDHHVERRHGR